MTRTQQLELRRRIDSLLVPLFNGESLSVPQLVDQIIAAIVAVQEDQGGEPWVVWSEEHGAWWGPQRMGYTPRLERAGRYTEAEALAIEARANRYLPAGDYNEMAMPDPRGRREQQPISNQKKDEQG
jgi:hypothetical protein